MIKKNSFFQFKLVKNIGKYYYRLIRQSTKRKKKKKIDGDCVQTISRFYSIKMFGNNEHVLFIKYKNSDKM